MESAHVYLQGIAEPPLGLGPAMLEMHGGQIFMQSEGRDRGTRFVVGLSLAAPSGAPTFQEAPR